MAERTFVPSDDEIHEKGKAGLRWNPGSSSWERMTDGYVWHPDAPGNEITLAQLGARIRGNRASAVRHDIGPNAVTRHDSVTNQMKRANGQELTDGERAAANVASGERLRDKAMMGTLIDPGTGELMGKEARREFVGNAQDFIKANTDALAEADMGAVKAPAKPVEEAMSDAAGKKEAQPSEAEATESKPAQAAAVGAPEAPPPAPQPGPQKGQPDAAGPNYFKDWLIQNKKLVYQLYDQLKGVGRQDSLIDMMREMYSIGQGGHKVDYQALRTIQRKYGIYDISGRMRTDGSVARSINRQWKRARTGMYEPRSE